MALFNAIGTKIKVLWMGAALTGSLFCMSPITAFANGLKCTCETKCTEDCVDPDCPLCQEVYKNCEGKESETEADVEETEDWGPLTPDGNLSIVDDYGTLEAGGKQFITVVTKNGNYFYIIIDRDDEGEETVHFLNMVDESDLLSLMDEDEVNKYIAVTSDSGDAKKDTTVATTSEPVTEAEVPEETTVVEEKKEKKTNVNGIMFLILLAAVSGVAGYMYYTTTKNSKKKSKLADPDEGYVEEPINLQTEEADFDVDASEDENVSEDVDDISDTTEEDTTE